MLIDWLKFKTSFQTSSGFNMVYNKEINEQLEIWIISSRQIGTQFFISFSYIFRKILHVYGRSRSLAITHPNVNINDFDV